jgi:hypothetical protein
MQMKFCTLKGLGHRLPTSFTWIIIFFDGAFEYGGISKCFRNAELLCVEFCNFGQCHISVSYLSSYS